MESKHVGDVFFSDPGVDWEQLEADEITQVGRPDWAISRLLFLLRQVNNSIQLDEVSNSDELSWFILFEVQENQNSVADLLFTVSKGRVGWSGQADTFYHSTAPIEELQAVMSLDPWEVAECEAAIPGRKSKVGWTGRRFRSQKKVKRPEYYSRDAMERRAASREAIQQNVSQARRTRKFRILEYPRSENDCSRNEATQHMRFTSVWPQPELWSATPNWSHAYDEEGRGGQDETTLKPSRNQSLITDDVDYSAGEAWLPDDTSIPVLIEVSGGEPRGVICFGDDIIWTFGVVPAGDERQVESDATKEQRRRFPLRVVSTLSRSNKDNTDNIRVRVDETGRCSQLPANWE